jgi:hypothetical protein
MPADSAIQMANQEESMPHQDSSPKHGSNSGEKKQASSQEKAPAKVQPSGYAGDDPATAGADRNPVSSQTPENRSGVINPSAPTQSTEGSSTNLGSSTDTAAADENPPGRNTGQALNPGETSGYGAENPTPQKPGKEGGGNLREHRNRDKSDAA